MTPLHYSSPACSPLNQLRRDMQDARRRLSMHNGTILQGRALGMLNTARANLRRYAYAQRGRKAAQHVGRDFVTAISGIPCGIKITCKDAMHPGNGIDEPPTGGNPEYIVTDLKGYEAPWLDRKSTHADHVRIMGEALEFSITGEVL